MGTLSPPSAWTMLHLLLSSSLLALATAEADPQLLYSNLPYAAAVPAAAVGGTVGAVAHVPVVKSDVVTPAEVEHEVTAHNVAVGYHGIPAFGYYGKRSADAEPAVLAGASRVLTPPGPLIHNPPVLPVAYAHPLGYAGLPYAGLPVLAAPAAAGEAVVAERKKREADPAVLLGGAVPYAGLTYAAAPAAFHPVGAVAKSVVVKSDVVTPAEVSHEVTAHAVPVAYHGLGYGYPYYG